VSDREDSGVVTLRRLFSLRVGHLTDAERFKVTAKDGIVEDGSFLVEVGSGRWGDAGVQESGISREDEADKGEEKGELDGLGVALRGVDVHPIWIEEEGGEDSSSKAKPS
jgi:hypothetical protein